MGAFVSPPAGTQEPGTSSVKKAYGHDWSCPVNDLRQNRTITLRLAESVNGLAGFSTGSDLREARRAADWWGVRPLSSSSTSVAPSSSDRRGPARGHHRQCH